MELKDIFGSILGGAGVVVIKALIDWLRNKDLDKADLSSRAVDTSERVMERMEKRMEDMEREIRLMKRRELVYARNQAELIRVIEELKFVMQEAGIDYDIEPELETVPIEL